MINSLIAFGLLYIGSVWEDSICFVAAGLFAVAANIYDYKNCIRDVMNNFKGERKW